MPVRDALTVLLLVASAGFYLAGTVGLLRFPDARSRLHAVTKADNLGLGLMVVALSLQAGSGWVAAKLVVIWLAALLSSAIAAYLIAGTIEGAVTPRDE